MIIVKLTGGLGNQMFQYAAGRRLAHLHNTALKLDLSWFSTFHTTSYPFRKYALNAFAIQEEIATLEEAEKIKESRVSGLQRFLSRFSGKPSGSYVKEKHYHFDPSVLELPDNVYLEGFWESEKYFSGIENIIRQEFTVKREADPVNREMAESIQRTEAVAVHVRRGDALINSKYYGVCSLRYYRSAVEKIAAQVSRPHLYYFSDEPEWVKENMKTDYPTTVVDHNGSDTAYEDIRLMSLCRHHVIANSTFSWWGAWLCRNPGKIVIAPEKWFNWENINTKDVIPGGWMKVSG